MWNYKTLFLPAHPDSFSHLSIICNSKWFFLLFSIVAHLLFARNIILNYIQTASKCILLGKFLSIPIPFTVLFCFFFYWQDRGCPPKLDNCPIFMIIFTWCPFIQVNMVLWHLSFLPICKGSPNLSHKDDLLGTFIHNEYYLVVSEMERICSRNKALIYVMSVIPFQETKLPFKARFKTV